MKEPKFIFPKGIAKKMKDVPQHIQMESTMLATTLLLFGLILIAIQQLFTGLSLALKVTIIFNIVCGMIIMGSTLVTSYQQYHNYIMTMGVDLKEEKKRLKMERKQQKLAQRAAKTIAGLRAAGYTITPSQPNTQQESFSLSQRKSSFTTPAETYTPPQPKQNVMQQLRQRRKERELASMRKTINKKKLMDTKENERRFIENL